MPVALSETEKCYIIDNYPTRSARQILPGLYLISGIHRKKGVVWSIAAQNGVRKLKKVAKLIRTSYAQIVADRDKITSTVTELYPMYKMKIEIKQFDLMTAMALQECNSYVLARKIYEFTGWNVTKEQVNEMQISTGMPRRYATDEVKRYLGL